MRTGATSSRPWRRCGRPTPTGSGGSSPGPCRWTTGARRSRRATTTSRSWSSSRGASGTPALVSSAMPTSLVTGGAGFLGSHLCDYLLARDHRVICVDNLETGSLENVEHLRDDAFTFVYQDVVDGIWIDEPVDYVFHLASPASPIDYLRLPLQTLK